MSLKFSKIVPKLTRGEVQRKEGESAPEPEKPAAEEKPELTPEAPIEVATEFVSAPTAAAPPPESPDAPPTPDTGAFQLGGEASQFAEDLLERAVGAQAEAAPHPDAEPEPAPAEEPAIPKSFGFDFDTDPDAPPSELAKAVSSALTDDPPSPFPEDEEGEEEEAAAADTGWLDQPAGPGVRPGGVPTHATETVDRRDTPAPPPPPAAEVSPRDIANELMLAADAGDTPPGGVPAAELERLLSSALEEEQAAAADAPAAADGPALDPSQVAPGDFRGLAAGLIAELEASLHPEPRSTPEERS